MIKTILKNGETLVIRKIDIEDVDEIVKYKKIIYGESDFLTFGENEIKINVEKERHSIETLNKTDNSILIIALLGDNVAGLVSFRSEERIRVKHVGELGITVRKKYWRLGIGSLLIESLIEWAKDTGIVRKINLRVRSDNEKAIKLYQKYGFKKEGILTRDFCIKGKFYDSISMGLRVD